MSQANQGKISSVNQLFDQKKIQAEDNIELHPKASFLYGESNIHGIEFSLIQNGKELGKVTALLTKDHKQVSLEGNLGIELTSKLKNDSFLPKVATAILPYFKEKKIDSILITCNDANSAVKKACTDLDATYLDTIDPGDGTTIKRFTLKTG